MIQAICTKCKHVYTACVILGIVHCPKCGGEGRVFTGV